MPKLLEAWQIQWHKLLAVQDLFSLAVVLYEIFTKTITAATVIVMGTPHECSDYAYKVWLDMSSSQVACYGCWPTLHCRESHAIAAHAISRASNAHASLTCTDHVPLADSQRLQCASRLYSSGPQAPARAPSNRCPCTFLQVARGYRRPCPQNWPSELAQLIMDCWAQDCDLRPPAAQARAVGSLRRAPSAHVIIEEPTCSSSSTSTASCASCNRQPSAVFGTPGR